MLIDRRELPVHGTQLMAFAADRPGLQQLREGLRAVAERADLQPLRRLFRSRRHLLSRCWHARQWTLPADTHLQSLITLTRRALRLAREDESFRETIHFRAPERLAQGARELTLCRHTPPPAHQLYAPRWLAMEDAYWRLARYPARQKPLGIEYGLFHFVLYDLFSRPGDPPWTGPREELSWVATVSPQPPIDFMDEVTYVQDGQPCTAPFAQLQSNLIDSVALTDLLTCVVGPLEVTRGPGAFLGPPPQSVPLASTDWSWLPFYRSFLTSFLDNLGGRFQVLEGEALVEAEAHVRAQTRPSRDWWDESDTELYEQRYASRPWRGWIPLEQIGEGWLPFRDRFADLLAEARQKDRAVLMTRNTLHEDEGFYPMLAPIDASWGAPFNHWPYLDDVQRATAG